MNTLAENILYIYLIVFLAVLGFDIACVFVRKLNEKHIEKQKKQMVQFLLHHKSRLPEKKVQKKLIHRLKRINYFIAFTSVVDGMTEKSKKECLTCLRYTFVHLLPYYQKQETIRQTYFVHFLQEHPYIYQESKNAIVNYLIQCTTANSIYLRENALNALYAMGSVACIEEAFAKMNYLNIHHHHKLITDGLLKFQGNVQELAEMLMKEYKNYQENYQVACINYFSYKKIDCQEFLYHRLIDESENKEVRLACIRYFKNNLYPRVVPVLYDFLKEEKKNWEYAALAATTLSSYQGVETTKHLIAALTSYNWYIRNNAAMSLSISATPDILDLINANMKDNYAKDALSYQMHLHRKE